MAHRIGHPLRSFRPVRNGAAMLLLVAALVSIPGAGSAGATPDQKRLGEFLWGLAGQESGWDYFARNRTSGAFGKYQIMPFNWPHWARRFVGDRWADQTPLNQELVARGKITNLYRWLGSFRRVAYWWLTGDTETRTERWSDSARRYVRNVIALMARAPDGGTPPPPAPAGGGAPVKTGDWRRLGVDALIRTGPSTTSARMGNVHDWTVVLVRGTGRDRQQMLWLRVETASGRMGWLKWRRTLPTGRPTNPDRWRDGEGPPGPRDPRARARPRPH